jgi:hypothetical protein
MQITRVSGFFPDRVLFGVSGLLVAAGLLGVGSAPARAQSDDYIRADRIRTGFWARPVRRSGVAARRSCTWRTRRAAAKS